MRSIPGILGLGLLLASACKQQCEEDGTGNIVLDNDSAQVHHINIDGEEVGTVYPGDTETFPVDPGEHTVDFKDDGGGLACDSLTVRVELCEDEHWSCGGGGGGDGGETCPPGYPLSCGTFCCPTSYPWCCPNGTCSATQAC